MATQEYIDDLIIVIETAEDAESVTNQMVAAVLGFLNEHLKLVSQGKEIEAEEAARIAADAALQKAIDAVSLRIDRLVGNNASQAIDNFNEILAFLDGLKDSDSLAALLADINARIGSEDGSQSEDGSLWGKLKSLSQDISSCSEDISTLQADRDEMKQELQETAGRLSSTFTNVNNLLNAGSVYSDLSGVFAALKTAGKIDDVRKNGVILSFLTADGWVTKQFKGNPDTDFENVEKWEDFGSGGSGGGNTYNVTGSVPLTEGFYTLASAIAAVPEKWRGRGRVITFETSLGKWETYQFTGTALDAWDQEASWEEFGGKGTVKSVTVNGEKQTPDAAGNVNVNVDILEVDETLSTDSTNPVENKVVTARFNEVDASTLFNVNAEVSEDETSVRLSFQNKSGAEITAVDIPAGSGGGSGETVATKIVLNAAVDNAIIKEGGNAVLLIHTITNTPRGMKRGNLPGKRRISPLRSGVEQLPCIPRRSAMFPKAVTNWTFQVTCLLGIPIFT